MPRDSYAAYRLITLNRFNEALHLLNKQLKKQPDSMMVKIWKCEALYGLGNIAESEEIMATIVEQGPSDKRTIEGVADFYRSSCNYEKLVEVYENVVKKDPNDEHWRKALFECCGLAGDYKKQQQQALLLYKQSPRMLFYCMAVVCLMQQANENPVALDLSERMMLKQHEAGKLKSHNEILLLINVYERRGKFKEALELLNTSAASLDALISTTDKKLELLISMKNWSAIVIELKQLLKDKPDNWHYLKLYIKTVLILEEAGGTADDPCVDDSAKRAEDYLAALAKDNSGLRGPLLGSIHLHSQLVAREEKKQCTQLQEEIVSYYHKFGEKTICAFDLSSYVSILPDEFKSELFAKLTDHQLNTIDNQELLNRMGIAKHVTFLQLYKISGFYQKLTVEERLKLCEDLTGFYRKMDGCDRIEQYLVLLAHERLTLYNITGDAEHLISAACELEDALVNLPAFALQVLLLQIYITLGATKAARKLYETLRIQSIQVDTLVHLLLSHLSSTGHFTIACEMWDNALRILQQCTAESLEALVWCYRAGLFHRVEELTQCGKRFQRTITVPYLRGEKNFLEVVVGEPSRVEQTLARVRVKVAWESCLDNRDLHALPSWSPPTSQQPAEQSYEELLAFCKLREALMFYLAAAIAVTKQRKSAEEEIYDSALKSLQFNFEDASDKVKQELFSAHSTRLHLIVRDPIPVILEKLVEPDLVAAEEICTLLQKSNAECLREISEKKSLNPRISLELGVTHVELLACVTALSGHVRAGLAVPLRRRSDQLIRVLESCWSSLEGALPAAQTAEQPQPSAIRQLVEGKLRESYQCATEDFRKVIRKKLSYLHKLTTN